MPEHYLVVYDASQINARDLYGGLVFVAIGVVASVYLGWRRSHDPSRGTGPFVGAALWLACSTAFVVNTVQTAAGYGRMFRDGTCEIAEGTVTVLREGLRTGHDSGDRIAIDGVEFEFSYFDASRPGYRQIISRGGWLTEGTRARVHHLEGDILKVEVASNEPQTESAHDPPSAHSVPPNR